VIAAVTEIGERYKADGVEATPAQQVKLNVHVSDVPFGEGTSRWGRFHGGPHHFQRGEVAEPEVTVTTDYATAARSWWIRIRRRRCKAFMAAKIRVQGNLMKLMALQPKRARLTTPPAKWPRRSARLPPERSAIQHFRQLL